MPAPHGQEYTAQRGLVPWGIGGGLEAWALTGRALIDAFLGGGGGGAFFRGKPSPLLLDIDRLVSTRETGGGGGDLVELEGVPGDE